MMKIFKSAPVNWNTKPDGIFLEMFTSFIKEMSEDLVLIMVDLIQGKESTGNTPPYSDSPVPEVRQESPFRSTFRCKVCKQLKNIGVAISLLQKYCVHKIH